MRILKKVRVAGGVLAAGSLLLVGVAGQANAELATDGGSTSDPCNSSYKTDGYSCGTTSPDATAVLLHVKLRGNLHELVIKFEGPDIGELKLLRKNSENVWLDRTRFSLVTVTLAGNSTVYFSVTTDKGNQNHCYFEDRNGNLAFATMGSDCTPY